MNKELLDDDVIVQISGGTDAETKELADYINAHGGSVSCKNQALMIADINTWIKAHSRELGISEVLFGGGDIPNSYGERKGRNRRLVKYDHAEMMARLKKYCGE